MSVAVLVAPAGALACGGGGTSATAVYMECGNNGGGSKTVDPNQKPLSVSQHTQKALKKHAGKHQRDLMSLVRNPNFGQNKGLAAIEPGSVVPPSAFSALFDLGAGPLALIAILIGSVVLLLAGTGWRGWRRWRGRLLA
jgi:hypothetical protein